MQQLRFRFLSIMTLKEKGTFLVTAERRGGGKILYRSLKKKYRAKKLISYMLPNILPNDSRG